MGIIGSYVIIRSDVFLYWQQRERVKDGGGDFHPFHFVQVIFGQILIPDYAGAGLSP